MSPDKGEWNLCQWRWVISFNGTGQASGISLKGFLIREYPHADEGLLKIVLIAVQSTYSNHLKRTSSSLCAGRPTAGMEGKGGFQLVHPFAAGAVSDDSTPQTLGLPGLSPEQLRDSLLHGCLERFKEHKTTSTKLSSIREEIRTTLSCNVVEVCDLVVLHICFAQRLFWLCAVLDALCVHVASAGNQYAPHLFGLLGPV